MDIGTRRFGEGFVWSYIHQLWSQMFCGNFPTYIPTSFAQHTGGFHSSHRGPCRTYMIPGDLSQALQPGRVPAGVLSQSIR